MSAGMDAPASTARPKPPSKARYLAFELNVRASVVVGLVGAGGIGSVIFVELARFNYANLSALVVALFVVVFVIDSASRSIRRRLIG